MTAVLSTWTHHTTSYTIPYTFKPEEWYVMAQVNATAYAIQFISGFTVHGAVSGASSAEYFEHGAYVCFGQATSSTVTIKVDHNYDVILVGELSST